MCCVVHGDKKGKARLSRTILYCGKQAVLFCQRRQRFWNTMRFCSDVKQYVGQNYMFVFSARWPIGATGGRRHHEHIKTTRNNVPALKHSETAPGVIVVSYKEGVGRGIFEKYS